MRRHVPLLLVGLFALVFAGAAVYFGVRDVAAQAPEGPGGAQRVLLQVEGLTCGSCEGKVQEALLALRGVRSVSVNLQNGTVAVDCLDGTADPNALAEAVIRAGYSARHLPSGPAPNSPAGAGPRAGCGGNCCSG